MCQLLQTGCNAREGPAPAGSLECFSATSPCVETFTATRKGSMFLTDRDIGLKYSKTKGCINFLRRLSVCL